MTTPSKTLEIQLAWSGIKLWVGERGELIFQTDYRYQTHELTDAEVDALGDLVDRAKAQRQETKANEAITSDRDRP